MPRCPLRPTSLSLAAALALAPTLALAQGQPAKPADKVEKLEQVVVTGIRASLEASIKTKKDALTNIEAVTAEDIGKLPDKNIADALSRLAGIQVTHGSAFAFDEAERVQIRGTPAKLNLVTINGHSLSSGDWFLGDQNATTRAVGFGMLPSQLIGKAIVYKNGQADITEGGIGGAVDVQTRKPLDLKKGWTGEVALGAAHTTLAGKTDPQASALVGWQNEAGTLGVLGQVFREDRSLRRDGVENFGVTTLLGGNAVNPAACFVPQGSPAGAAPICGDASLRGKRLPSNLASALFEGERQRRGGFLAVQLKPTRDFDVTFTGFDSKLDASNYNSNTFTFASTLLNNGAILTNVKTNGDVITAATINPNPARVTAAPVTGGDAAIQSGHQVRLNAGSTASFYDLDFGLRANERLRFTGKIGFTKGTGETETSPGLLFRSFNKQLNYELLGKDGVNWGVQPGVSLSDLSQGGWKLISDIQAVFRTKDQDRYTYLNGEYDLDDGFLTRIKFGARLGTHRNSKDQIQGAWNFVTTGSGIPSQAALDAQFPMSSLPTQGGLYPADYGNGISGNFPRQVLRLDRGAMAGINSLINYDEVLNKNWAGSYIVNERTTALYAMAEFESGALTGNVGTRLVGTEVNSVFYQAMPNNRVCAALTPVCPTPTGVPVQTPISSSRISGYMQQEVTTNHSAMLPSLNLRYELSPTLLGRFSVSRTMARPEYSELAGATSQNNLANPKTANSGNPNLKPTMGSNADASLAYYASRRAYVQGGVFYQELKDYVKRGTSLVELKNSDTQQFETYVTNSFIGRDARLKGFEISGETPLGAGFGVVANLTHVDGVDQDGAKVIGTSKWTYNLRAYYEQGGLTASLAWNHRSDYPVSYFGNGTITPATPTAARNDLNYADAQSSLAASISYRITPQISLQLDGSNLTNPSRYYYSATEDMPLGWYKNGRQFFLSLRAKL
jgi:iron complex outermembrane recepter protein